MRLWFTPQETADAWTELATVGLPTTKRGVAAFIERENWQRYSALCRTRAGREGGGGWEYHVEQWPIGARLAYFAKAFAIEAADLRRPLPAGDGISERERLSRDARLAATRMADRFRRSIGLGAKAADAAFTQLFNSRSISVPEWVIEGAGTISPRTLARWRAKATAEPDGLGTDRAKARKGKGLLDTANEGAVRLFIFALLGQGAAFSAEDVRTQCRDEFGDEIFDRHGEMHPMPPVRTFQHFIRQLKEENKVALTKLTDPDRYRSHYALSGTGSLRHVRHPNQLWQIDASPMDALCVDGRHSIYACIDIATRRTVVTVSKTPRASAVGWLIRKAILKWGVAAEISTDNGSDFTAKETERLFEALDIEADVCDAYSPEQKGHVERVIKTLQHGLAPKLPGYVGHSVADRKRIEGRKSFAARMGDSERETFGVSMTAEELSREIDAWLDDYYEHRPHEGFRGSQKGMSPAEVAAASKEPVRTVDASALDGLLMPAAGGDGLRTVTKRGIRIDGFHYMTASILPGTLVFVRLDPRDKGRVHVYSADAGAFLGIATCPELAGVDPASFVKAVKQEAAERMRAAVAPVKAEMRRIAKGPTAIERARRVHRRDADAREAETANIIRLPRREEIHTTPRIDAAKEAVEQVSKPLRSIPLGEAALERHRQLVAELGGEPARGNVTRLRLEETPTQRFSRLIAIERRRDHGEALSEDEAYELGSYQQSAEYKSRKMILDDFGDTAPGLRS